MRKVISLLAAIGGITVSAFMMYFSYEEGRETFVFNASFFALMMIIMLLAMLVGFTRINRLRNAFIRGEKSLNEINNQKMNVKAFGTAERNPFGMTYLDSRYREYMTYYQKTNGDGDILDYINEDSMSSYFGQKVLEIIPEILTSLGILGTFIGLILGLRGFDPVTYEAMATSITSLIDGIKVAFITSILGITWALVFSFWLKGMQDRLQVVFDSFLEKYYLCEAPTRQTKTIDNISDEQKKQTDLMQKMLKEIKDGQTELIGQLKPISEDMTHTMQKFIDIVTLNQIDLTESVMRSVSRAVTDELQDSVTKMTDAIENAEKAQEKNIDKLNKAYERHCEALNTSSSKMQMTMNEHDSQRRAVMEDFKEQQRSLRNVVTLLTQIIEDKAEESSS